MKTRLLNVFIPVFVCMMFVATIFVYSADKLLVKNEAGDGNVLLVTDTGSVGVNYDTPVYPLDVTSDGVARSQLHFSIGGSGGGWLTSVIENNFWISSGAVFESPNWIQKAASGKSVFFGSGDAGFSAYMQQGNTNGNVISNATRVMHVLYNGYMGINRSDPAYPLHMGNNAYCSTGGVWTNASSREYKENIAELTTDAATEALRQLVPVSFNYKNDKDDTTLGFIAEDVPELVATKDRKGLSSMDVVAVLTKVMQEQQNTIADLRKELNEVKATLAERNRASDAM